jgi:hypothetical protein
MVNRRESLVASLAENPQLTLSTLTVKLQLLWRTKRSRNISHSETHRKRQINTKCYFAMLSISCRPYQAPCRDCSGDQRHKAVAAVARGQAFAP